LCNSHQKFMLKYFTETLHTAINSKDVYRANKQKAANKMDPLT
jgi:hypothetical protein